MRTRPWWPHTAAVFAVVSGVLVLAVRTAWPLWDYAFFSDDSPVSWLSSALLAANAGVALVAAFGAPVPRRFGLLAVALAGLAVDEQFHLHERAQESFGDGIVMAYAALLVSGGLASVWALGNRATTGAVRTFLLAAVGAGAMAVAVDLGVGGAAWAFTEELWEVVAETLWLCGLLEVCRVQVQSGSST